MNPVGSFYHAHGIRRSQRIVPLSSCSFGSMSRTSGETALKQVYNFVQNVRTRELPAEVIRMEVITSIMMTRFNSFIKAFATSNIL
jgi:hypothetical protein